VGQVNQPDMGSLSARRLFYSTVCTGPMDYSSVITKEWILLPGDVDWKLSSLLCWRLDTEFTVHGQG
jgi:hypothetical protein